MSCLSTVYKKLLGGFKLLVPMYKYIMKVDFLAQRAILSSNDIPIILTLLTIIHRLVKTDVYK